MNFVNAFQNKVIVNSTAGYGMFQDFEDGESPDWTQEIAFRY